MPTLYLVRHGQASFGADDYDQLSALGERQCHALGVYLRERGIAFEAALVGTLRRQQQSLLAIGSGHGSMPDALSWPGLNEYDSAAVLAAFHPLPLARPETAEDVRHHFRLLRSGLAAWMAGRIAPAGMPAYDAWRAGILGALDHVRERCRGDVLLVSSGGPIATAVGHVLGTSPEATIELNLRIGNSALTEFAYTPKRHVLVSFNHLPHLDHAERRDWLTHT